MNLEKGIVIAVPFTFFDQVQCSGANDATIGRLKSFAGMFPPVYHYWVIKGHGV